jgi:hypothetical protein
MGLDELFKKRVVPILSTSPIVRKLIADIKLSAAPGRTLKDDVICRCV